MISSLRSFKMGTFTIFFEKFSQYRIYLKQHINYDFIKKLHCKFAI